MQLTISCPAPKGESKKWFVAIRLDDERAIQVRLQAGKFGLYSLAIGVNTRDNAMAVTMRDIADDLDLSVVTVSSLRTGVR
jgi:hypothetical protein